MDTNFGSVFNCKQVSSCRDALEDARQYFKKNLYDKYYLQKLTDEELEEKFKFIEKITGLSFKDKLAQILCYILYDEKNGEFIAEHNVIGLNIFNDCPELLVQLINTPNSYCTVDLSQSPVRLAVKYDRDADGRSAENRISSSLLSIFSSLKYHYKYKLEKYNQNKG